MEEMKARKGIEGIKGIEGMVKIKGKKSANSWLQ
jgi:hypothetical protein